MAPMRSLCLLFVLLHQLCVAIAFAENFPKPVVLQHDVDFWLKIYTEADTRSGYIHDSVNLSVVYEKIDIKGGPRANKRHIKQTKAKYASTLKSLASGKRTNLSKDERYVLSLWGHDVDNQQLRNAANTLRFQRGQSDRFHRGLERSGEWRSYIEKTLTDMNLPVELSVLPHVESSFNPKAYSHVGAAGIWQFIRSTGRRYMRIDHVIDERMDPFASTVAAAKLLRHNYQLTQSWPLALTAYNHGVASMRRAIDKLGTRDIAIIARQYKGRAFGFASRNFYVAFLAALEVDSHPNKYFSNINFAQAIDYETVTLGSYYFAKDLAKYLNVSKSRLKQYNRSLLDSVWSDTKRIPKGFVLRVPKALLTDSASSLLAGIPKALQYKEQTPDEFHYVQRGDTISEIADDYGYKVKDILAANNMNRGHYIRVGQKIRLPVKGGVTNKQIALNKQTKSKLDIVTKDSDVEQSSPEGSAKLDAMVKVEDVVSKNVVDNKIALIDIDNVNIEGDLSADLDVNVVAEQDVSDKQASVLLTDPADYTVDERNTIKVQASETLGHYAEWLDIRASRLRQINNMKFGEPVVIGKRIKLEFSAINRDQFEKRRVEFQKKLQGEFFTKYRIDSTSQYKIRRGESVWVLALRKFKVPMWLLRQHNPDVNFNLIQPGTQITVPSLMEVSNTL